MPFIGQQPTTGAFLELDSLTASATADYTLQLNGANYEPESVNNLLVSINGVIQGSNTMSLSGSTLTVGATLSASDVIDFVRVFGNVGTISTPTDGSVTANKIGTGAVDLTSKVTGVLPVANGGTGVSSATGMVKILDTTITNQADFVLTSSHINSTYDRYQMFYHFLPATDATNLYAYAYVNGSRVTSTNHSIQIFPLDGGGVTTNTSIDIFFRLNKYNVGNASGEGVSGSAILQNVNSTTAPYCISGQNTETFTAGTPIQNVFGGSAKPSQRADVLNGIQFIFSGGNIASGTFQLYGVV